MHAIDKAKNEKNIYRSNAYIVRGIIIDHAFLDGNKRTAISVITNRFRKEGILCDKEMMTNGMISIAKNNIHDISRIESRLRKWCSKK